MATTHVDGLILETSSKGSNHTMSLINDSIVALLSPDES